MLGYSSDLYKCQAGDIETRALKCQTLSSCIVTYKSSAVDIYNKLANLV